MTEMSDVDHTHQHTDEPFGEKFGGGGAVAADGGEADDDGSAAEPGDGEDSRMRDVDHESPDGTGADRAFERGEEGRDETV